MKDKKDKDPRFSVPGANWEFDGINKELDGRVLLLTIELDQGTCKEMQESANQAVAMAFKVLDMEYPGLRVVSMCPSQTVKENRNIHSYWIITEKNPNFHPHRIGQNL